MQTAKAKLLGRPQLIDVAVNPTDKSVVLAGMDYKVEDLAWDVPVSGTVYGTLLNYKGALAALGQAVQEAPYKEAPKAPILYIKPVNTFLGYGFSIPLPRNVSQLEMGASLGVVIGRNATRVSEQEALDYVQGYTVVNDVSIPHDSIYRPAIIQKARDGFCPMGPWIIERKALKNPDAVNICVYINDQLVQENNTANLIRPVARLIADVTEFMTLSAGDTLLVGVAEGAPLAQAGDQVRIEISGVGILENKIEKEEELQRGGQGE